MYIYRFREIAWLICWYQLKWIKCLLPPTNDRLHHNLIKRSLYCNSTTTYSEAIWLTASEEQGRKSALEGWAEQKLWNFVTGGSGEVYMSFADLDLMVSKLNVSCDWMRKQRGRCKFEFRLVTDSDSAICGFCGRWFIIPPCVTDNIQQFLLSC